MYNSCKLWETSLFKTFLSPTQGRFNYWDINAFAKFLGRDAYLNLIVIPGKTAFGLSSLKFVKGNINSIQIIKEYIISNYTPTFEEIECYLR